MEMLSALYKVLAMLQFTVKRRRDYVGLCARPYWWARLDQSEALFP